MNKQKILFLFLSWGFLSIAQSQRPLPKELGDQRTTEGVPEPVLKWDFKQNDHEIINGLPGHLVGEAKIENGKLCLPSEGSYYKTDPVPLKLTEKTMIAQVYLDNLEQRGGGLITVESINGVTFDSIVYGEGKSKIWNNGSESGIRIKGNEGAEETASSEQPIWMAASYSKDGTISLYKNGTLYRSIINPETPLQHFKNKKNDILLGKRHEGGGHPYLSCKIEYAEIYDTALNEKQISALYVLRKKRSFQVTKGINTSSSDGLPSRLLVITHEPYSESLVEKAEKGNAKAQVDLGYNYYFGKGVVKSYEQANYWYKKAADQGNANAQSNLASNYCEGRGIEKDMNKAIDLTRKAANQGFAPAQDGLALMFCQGKGVKVDTTEAFKWHLKAAQQGWYPAILRVACHYKKGIGVPQNDYLASQWQNISDINKVAWEGSVLAVDQDANSASRSRRYEESTKEELDKTETAVDSKNNPRNAAQVSKVGKDLNASGTPGVIRRRVIPIPLKSQEPLKEVEPKQVEPWDYSPDLVRRAEAGDVVSQVWLGDRYNEGKGVAKNDDLATKWWKKAADQGNPDGQFQMGWRCWDGKGGVTRDRAEATRYWKLSADQKNIWSMAALGNAYLNGDGMPQDYNEAVKYLCVAKDGGSSWAQASLGRCYENGWGVPKDRQEAIRLYRRACVMGPVHEREIAKSYLKEIEAETPK
jgi:hypothetical protein